MGFKTNRDGQVYFDQGRTGAVSESDFVNNRYVSQKQAQRQADLNAKIMNKKFDEYDRKKAIEEKKKDREQLLKEKRAKAEALQKEINEINKKQSQHTQKPILITIKEVN